MKKIINSRKVELKKLIMMTGIALSAIALTSKVDTIEAYASSGEYWEGPMVEESKRDLDVLPEPIAPEPMPTPVPVAPESSSSIIVEENDDAPIWEDKDFEDDKKDIPVPTPVPIPMTDEELEKYYESEIETATADKPEAVANDDYVVISETTEEPLEETVTPVKENKKSNDYNLYLIILAALGTTYSVYKVNSKDEDKDDSFDPEYEDSYQTEEEQVKRRWL